MFCSIINAFTASAGDGCMRASAGFRASMGQPPRLANLSNTCCMSAAGAPALGWAASAEMLVASGAWSTFSGEQAVKARTEDAAHSIAKTDLFMETIALAAAHAATDLLTER
jgi:hypothetical protein